MCIYSLHPGHLEAEQNDRKVIRSKIKKKGVNTRESKERKIRDYIRYMYKFMF